MTVREEYGCATIDPATDVVAGEFGTWRLTYTAGRRGLAVGGGLRVYTDSDTDWGIPQFHDPAAAEYMTLRSPEGVAPAVRIERQGALRCFIEGRDLKPGEEIEIVFGDTCGGGPGSRAQTFAEDGFFYWIDVFPSATERGVTLDDPPRVRIVGDDAVRLRVTAPSDVVVGEEFSVLLKAEDRWGNPTARYTGTVDVSGEDVERTASSPPIRFADNPTGALWVDGFRTVRPGTLTVTAVDPVSELRATSNPIASRETAGEHRLFWADPHGGQLVLNSKFDGFFRYARDVAGVQFVGFQRNADVISPEDWERQQQAEHAHYEPGRFVPIPGYEWSGRTWMGGHHNIYFRRHNQPVRRNLPADEVFQVERATADLAHIRDVHRAYRNTDVTITLHVGGEHSNLDEHEPTLEPAVEIVSTHGMFEWMLRDALKRGYRLGFVGGSDSFTGRPGDDRPGFQFRRYSKAGLTGIYARDVSLESFHEALRARRVFATTGARMILHTSAEGHSLGEEYTTSQAPTITASVTGTAALESVELFRGLERIHTVPFERRPISNRVRLLWRGSSRMTSYSGVVWDGLARVRRAGITAVAPLRFDSPRSRIIEQTHDTVRWQAWGCGYPMALLLDVDNPDDAVLEVSLGTRVITGPGYGGHGSDGPRRISFAPAENGTLSVRLSDLLSGAPRKLDLGILERQLRVELVSAPGPLTTKFHFTDPTPRPGVNPYWMRVVQSDLETGWTSPLFIDYCPPVG